MDKQSVHEICEDLGFGFLDEALARLPSDTVPADLLENPEVKSAAIRGIGYHLLDSRGNGNIETAIRMRDLFGIPNTDIEGGVKQGMKNWLGDKGPEFAEKIRLAFDVPEAYMESSNMKEAQQRWTRLYERMEQSKGSFSMR